MKRLSMLVVICASILSLPSPVEACGGLFESTSIEYAISEYFVSATVLEVDDTGYNAILKVDRYFNGSGGEYLLVMRYPPALQTAGPIRRYDTGCLYDGGGYIWQPGSYGYFGLYARADGSYGDYGVFPQEWGPGSGHYFENAGEVTFYSKNAGDYGGSLTLATDEFENLLLRLSGRGDAIEPHDNPYPLMRFLNITTESGKRYRLNPDYSVSWLDPDKWPVAISNDGSHVMFRLENGELGFQYLALAKKTYDPFAHALGSIATAGGRFASGGRFTSYGWLEPQTGNYGLFAPDSNYVAVQEDSRLVVYVFGSTSITGAAVGYGRDMTMTEVARHDTDWLTTAEKAPMAWSADSTTIAYQDSRGIWHWDIFEKATPHMVARGDARAELLDLSRSGRYVRYSKGESWNLFDIASGEEYEQAISTPDERKLIFIKRNFPEGTVRVHEEEFSRPFGSHPAWRTCDAPLSRCPVNIQFGNIIDYFEYQPGWIGLVSDRTVKVFPWYMSMEDSPSIDGATWPRRIIAFDFDSTYKRPAMVIDEFEIALSFSKGEPYFAVDLREHLDSAIAEVEWGQPVFLDRR